MLTINEIQQLDSLTPYERYIFLDKINKRMNRSVYLHNMLCIFTGGAKRRLNSLLALCSQYDKESFRMEYKRKLQEAQSCEGWSPSLKDIPDNI